MISTKQKLFFNSLTQDQINVHFNDICGAITPFSGEDNLELISFLLSSNDLCHNAQINNTNNLALKKAITVYNMPVIKFLLENQSIKEDSKILQNVFTWACNSKIDALSLVKYLLNNSQYAQKIKLDQTTPLINAFKSNNFILIQYLIEEKNYITTTEMLEKLKEINKVYYSYILQIKMERELPRKTNIRENRNKI